MAYGTLIQRARKGRGLTQEELAAKIGVTASNVSRWENDRLAPRYEYLDDLSAVLGISMDQLVSAIGVRLRPSPTASLYPPLADYLETRSLREQRALYDFFQAAESARGEAPRPRRRRQRESERPAQPPP